jgi:type IX secretion system substrate protein
LIVGAEVPNHIETFNGSAYMATNGKGSIAIKTLLPGNTNATLVGGNGFEYWVDGENYPPDPAPDSTFLTSGKWRIEVKPLANTDSVVFLHTIHLGDTTNIATPNGIALQSEFSVGADWYDTLYFFPNGADTGLTYHLFNEVAGNRTVGIFASGLMPGLYDIKVDGQTQTSLSPDTNGVLQSSVILYDGGHMLEITLNTTAINEFHQSDQILVFPNPVGSWINILPPQPSCPFKISIYDMKGTLLLSKEDQLTISTSKLPPGQYFVKIEQRQKFYTTKFIKL